MVCGDVKGKKITCYPACGYEVKLSGAEFTECALDKAVVDGNIVTAPAWPAHPEALKAFIGLLGCKI